MRIEHYFLMTDYALWEVIVNRDSPLPKRTVDGVEQTYPPTTVDEKLARKNELKARGTLLMALPNEHQLKFNTYKCAKTLMKAIEKRLQNLISQLEILGETISQKDMNLKFLRSLSSEWKTHTLIWRNKPDLDTLSMDDLYNNLKIYETEVKGSNQAYGSNSANTDSMSDVVIYSFFANQSSNPQLNDEDLRQINADDLEEMDLKWQMALAPRENRNKEPIRRNVTVETTKTKALVAQDGLGYDWSDQVEEGPINFALMAYTSSGTYKAGLEFVETRLDVYKKNEVIFEEVIKILKLDIKLRDNALTELRNKFEKAEKERDDLKLNLEKFENSSKNLSKRLEIQVSDKFKTGVGYDSQVVNSQVVDSQMVDSQVNDKHKTGKGYHAVPPPYTGNFMPPKPNLVLDDEEEYIFSESITRVHAVATSKVKTSESKPKSVSEPLIEDWISDSEDENETEFKSKQRKPSFAKIEFVKSNEHVKTPRESVKKVENNKQAKYPRKNSQSPRGNQRNWNNLMTQKLGSNFEFKNKACYECGSFNHLIKDCDFYEKKMVKNTVWNNARRVNHQNSQRMTHPHPKGSFVPKAVLIKSGIKTLNTAGQNSSKAAVSVNTARPINTAYLRPTVNSARTVSNVFNRAHSHVRRPFNKSTTNKNSNLNEKVNTVKGNVTTAGPKAVVSDKKGNEANAVKASACWVWRPKQKVLDHVSRHNGASMNFKRFDYVDAQGRSKSVMAWSPDFKLLDENYVLLRVPRKDNKYSVDLKNIVPSGGLTCLFAKATLDESNLWHMRIRHIHFKTMNKLVRGNLVRGLPSKIFENNHTCVACQKGKQHKASCKTKTLSQMTIVGLVGFFFIATKDKTSEILKTFITGIENLIDLKVKVIRCDNGTEFKNKVMNQFCGMKGIKREFSVSRTPQQNGVAERKNRTLIEAARTMLADSKLPTTFWAKSVNIACRKPALSFMRPFGCLVTILNTIYHLGKFDGKVDEWFFIGYSTNSKAFRVFNSRTRIVEENLRANFSEDTPNIVGSGPNWFFDIDALTKSMNYKPVVAGNQSNGSAGTKACNGAGKARMETVPGKDYILVGKYKSKGQRTAKQKVKVLLSRKSTYCQLKIEVLPWIKES
ncbi:putative ribonuclease H-like domain-containing protein [Tanacetum coccineum]